jgi:hypothetical protein
LHSPTPLAVFTGTTCSLKPSPTRRHVLCRASQEYCEQTRVYLCANGLHAAVVSTPARPCLKKTGNYPAQNYTTRKRVPRDTAGTEFRRAA